MNEVSELLAGLDELILLTPALPAALLRDRGAGHGGPMPVHRDPHRRQVNSDVSDALDLLIRELGTPITDKLTAMRNWVINDGQEPDELLDEVSRWRYAVRKALRLSEPSKALGTQVCPDHPSEPVRLLVGGREGHLQPVPNDGDEVISWSYLETIFCPGCGREWQRAEWNALAGRLATMDHWAQVNRQLAEALESQRLADGPALSKAYNVPTGTIRQWANRGVLTRHSKDSRGRIRYSIAEFETVLGRMRGATCQDPYAV